MMRFLLSALLAVAVVANLPLPKDACTSAEITDYACLEACLPYFKCFYDIKIPGCAEYAVPCQKLITFYNKTEEASPAAVEKAAESCEQDAKSVACGMDCLPGIPCVVKHLSGDGNKPPCPSWVSACEAGLPHPYKPEEVCPKDGSKVFADYNCLDSCLEYFYCFKDINAEGCTEYAIPCQNLLINYDKNKTIDVQNAVAAATACSADPNSKDCHEQCLPGISCLVEGITTPTSPQKEPCKTWTSACYPALPGATTTPTKATASESIPSTTPAASTPEKMDDGGMMPPSTTPETSSVDLAGRGCVIILMVTLLLATVP